MMQNLNINLFERKANYHRPLVFNGVLWSLAFVILLFVFSKGNKPITIDYIYTVTFLIALAIPASINFYVLMPKLLKKERYIAYILAFIFNLVVFAYLSTWLLEPILDLLFTSFFFISYLTKENIFFVFTIFLVVSTLIKLAEDWFYFNKSENKILRLKNQQIETQLSALRAQINPHFLFNSLNVIYALALEQKEGITNAIVQLSDILRYVIYDSDNEQVSLKDEIKLLKNYIAFQDHRVNTPNTTKLELEIENEDFKIYPMLLLPLLENSYKHGIDTSKTEQPITITMSQANSKFEFIITNKNLDTNNQLRDKHSGVGLENIKNNLNLVYPNNHQFEVSETSDQFKVRLSINNDNA
ncbi:sensor histidine kinase [Winogradskyella tangerina]|uniref:sensor histidine kinase n=1 Tax=Winogradskyella tangerina TaxID=2023240 RepID=UPI000DBE34E0|nr:histidine kinase [Winogradskyella tangerina]